jgi:hypothetical protein
MAVTIAGRPFWLWRAVDDEGEVLDLLVQRRRDRAAAVKLMRKLLGSSASHREKRRRILLLAPGNDPQKVTGQGPLQLQCIRRFAFEPEIDLFRRRQDSGHRLRVNGRDDGVRLRRQEPKQFMLTIHRRALGSPDTAPWRL